jgi:antitoxin component HigA of HigAB toxin-antitoxin module
LEEVKPRATARAINDPKSLGFYVMPRDENEYDAAVAELNRLLDEVGDDTKDPRYRLIETLSALVEAYDDEHNDVPEISGADMLRYLMAEHNLVQADLVSGRARFSKRRVRDLERQARVERQADLQIGPTV